MDEKEVEISGDGKAHASKKEEIETADAPHHRRESVNAMDKVIHNAKAATDKEHKMSLWQGIKLYPKAVAWSMLISTCIAMEGYDVCLLSNFYGFPQFNRKYGEQLPDGTWQIPPHWQAGLSNGANVGEIIGLFINGFVSEKYGYRYTVMTCLTLIVAFTAIFFTAKDVVALQVAEILCGIPWGVFQTLTITYASEVCPVALRGYRKFLIFTTRESMADRRVLNSDYLCKLLLGLGPSYRHWSHQVNASSERPMVLQNSVCTPVDVACAIARGNIPRPRVSMVVGEKGSDRRCKEVSVTFDQLGSRD